MSRFNINLHFDSKDVIKQVIIIAVSIVGIYLFNQYFPQDKLPKSFIFKTVIYMLIYVLVALVVESISRSISNRKKK